MCQALDEWMADERAEGMREGKRIGIEEGIRKGEKNGKKKGKKEERMIIIRCMLQEGMDKELIRKVTKCSGKELSMAAEQ